VRGVAGTKRLRLRLDVTIELAEPIYRDLPTGMCSPAFTTALVQAVDTIGETLPGFVRVDTIDYDVRADRRPLKSRKKDG